MIKKLYCSIAILTLFCSCGKDSGTPDPDFSNKFEKKLGAYVWQPVYAEDTEKDNISNYKPDECEMDNSYRFLFQEKSNQLDLNKGIKICNSGKVNFEYIFSKAKNSSNFTFNKETGTIKFEDQDQYSSYLVVVNGDKLVLTYQNNNPVANVIPMKYYFKGVKK